MCQQLQRFSHGSLQRRLHHRKAQMFPDQRCIQRDPRVDDSSMDTNLFLISIVQFYNYIRDTHPQEGDKEKCEECHRVVNNNVNVYASVNFQSLHSSLVHRFRYVISEVQSHSSLSLCIMVVSSLYHSIVQLINRFQTDWTSESNAASFSATSSTTFSFLPE